MPFGCFGKRKKKDKSVVDGAGTDGAPGAPISGAADGAKNGGETEINETVVAARVQGQQSAAPGSNIQKSATLARYDFLRKSDYVNSADRWAALKEQYLAPKMTQSQHGSQLASSEEPSSAPPAANGPPALGRRTGGGRAAQSLPRQFSPPSTVVSVVKFSHWFYERQIREEEARREAQEREERSRAEEEQHQRDLLAAEAAGHSAEEEAAAAARIQAGFKGYQTRKHLAEAKEHEQPQQQPEQHSQHPSADEHLDVDESDPRVNQAATKIQAGFKGMQARKEVKELRKHKDEEASAATTGHNAAEDGNHLHGNVEQPSAEEQNAAAAKIQAGFKGYKTRKEMGLLHEQEGHGEQQQQHQEDEANS
ncbi:hypothetical protein BOX15_Mlig000068g2 [Macrostomum lignano]|uniref:Uncharacterized protein n=1 Tax=Macrostomum lignano TaxID=282301 RepID=A0A267F5P8_9PLAT|nr:hypothetical protein BOX15_Mlig000068g2 [Macrostomum lignano]